MDVKINRPPRSFRPGRSAAEITDCGHIRLGPDEQVTFTTEAGAENDVVRKAWGFYATGSLNGRLPRNRLRPALVRNGQERYYVVLVEDGRLDEFRQYLGEEGLVIATWLDDETLRRFETTTTANLERGSA